MRHMTQETIDTWPLPLPNYQRRITSLFEEKTGIAGPATFILLATTLIFLFGAAMASQFLTPALSVTIVILAMISPITGAILIEKYWVDPFLMARWKAINDYLRETGIQTVMAQATSDVPCYTGRIYLFEHLDKRAPEWSQDCLEALKRLARSEEIHGSQRTFIVTYLNKKHSGWSLAQEKTTG